MVLLLLPIDSTFGRGIAGMEWTGRSISYIFVFSYLSLSNNPLVFAIAFFVYL